MITVENERLISALQILQDSLHSGESQRLQLQMDEVLDLKRQLVEAHREIKRV